MNMKMNAIAGSALSTLLLIAGITPASAQVEERTLRGGVVSPVQHPSSQGLAKFGEVLAEKSGGKIELQPFYSGQIGDDRKMIEATQLGIQDVVITSTSPMIGIVPEFGVFDLPFVINNVKEGAALLDGTVGEQLNSFLPDHRLVGLAFFENGMRNLTNSRRPVATLEDFNGLRIRVQQNEVFLDTFAALEANPIPMPYTEVFGALETKTIDGAENALPVFVSDKYSEVQDYVSMTEHVYAPILLAVSKKLWDSLSDEEKQIFEEAAAEAETFQRELNRQKVDEAADQLRSEGMEINEIAPEERERIQAAVAPVVDSYSDQPTGRLLGDIREQLETIRAN